MDDAVKWNASLFDTIVSMKNCKFCSYSVKDSSCEYALLYVQASSRCLHVYDKNNDRDSLSNWNLSRVYKTSVDCNDVLTFKNGVVLNTSDGLLPLPDDQNVKQSGTNLMRRLKTENIMIKQSDIISAVEVDVDRVLICFASSSETLRLIVFDHRDKKLKHSSNSSNVKVLTDDTNRKLTCSLKMLRCGERNDGTHTNSVHEVSEEFFAALFGMDAALFNSHAVLIGLSDGRVLFWTLKQIGAERTSSEASEPNLLCDLEEQIIDIAVCRDTNKSGNDDRIVVIGCDGKVMIISMTSPSYSSNHILPELKKNSAKRPNFTELCIPGPVQELCISDLRLVHSTVGSNNCVYASKICFGRETLLETIQLPIKGVNGLHIINENKSGSYLGSQSLVYIDRSGNLFSVDLNECINPSVVHRNPVGGQDLRDALYTLHKWTEVLNSTRNEKQRLDLDLVELSNVLELMDSRQRKHFLITSTRVDHVLGHEDEYFIQVEIKNACNLVFRHSSWTISVRVADANNNMFIAKSCPLDKDLGPNDKCKMSCSLKIPMIDDAVNCLVHFPLTVEVGLMFAKLADDSVYVRLSNDNLNLLDLLKTSFIDSRKKSLRERITTMAISRPIYNSHETNETMKESVYRLSLFLDNAVGFGKDESSITKCLKFIFKGNQHILNEIHRGCHTVETVLQGISVVFDVSASDEYDDKRDVRINLDSTSVHLLKRLKCELVDLFEGVKSPTKSYRIPEEATSVVQSLRYDINHLLMDDDVTTSEVKQMYCNVRNKLAQTFP